MPMNKDTLALEIASALKSFFETCESGEGLSKEAYADEFAGIIAEKVVNHIKNYASVSTTVTGTAGSYPITGGKGSGRVS